jgi:hypothetical protein
MAPFRQLEFEKFLRRKIPGISFLKWEPGRGHGLLTVSMEDGREVMTRVPGTATDQPRRRENIVSAIRKRLNGQWA